MTNTDKKMLIDFLDVLEGIVRAERKWRLACNLMAQKGHADIGTDQKCTDHLDRLRDALR